MPFVLLGYALLISLLIGAVVIDVRSHRIPNRLVLAGLALAGLVHLIAITTASRPLAGDSWWAPLAGVLTGLALLLPLYLLRACAAGDVKLMAMVGAFVGTQAVLSATLYTLVAGGVLSLVVMALRGVTKQTLANLRYILTDWGVRASQGQSLRLAPLTHTAARLPYAVAISVGTLAALLRPLPLLS